MTKPRKELRRRLASGMEALGESWSTLRRLAMTGRATRPAERAIVALAYLAVFAFGAVVWTYILDAGRIPFGLHDWAEGTGHRLAFLQNAVRELRWPLHMPDGSALRNVTDRFLSVPDTIVSPQVLLLRALDLGPFVLVNTLLWYTVGFWGMCRLSRRLGWSPLVFAAVFLMTSLNGHIVDHVVVGNMHWVGYFVLPFFFELLFDMLEGAEIHRWSLRLSIVFLALVLQGAYHLFVMGLLFLAILAFGRRRWWKYGLLGETSALLVSAVRILPPALEVGKFDTEFLSGFVSLHQLGQGLVELRVARPDQVFSQTPLSGLGWWEIDHYIGWIGLGLVLAFGGYGWARAGKASRMPSALAMPAFVMALLSIGQLYEVVNRSGIPLLASQRVSTRLFVFPLLVLLLSLGVHLQEVLGRRARENRSFLAALGLFVLLAQDLWQHAKLWRVSRMYELFRNLTVDLSGEYVANHPDPPYTTAILAGLALGVATVASLAWASHRATRDDS